MSQKPNHENIVSKWRDQAGDPLKNALRTIRSWTIEGNPSHPRSISYNEFKARVEGWITFDDNRYVVADGWAEVLSSLAAPDEIDSATNMCSTREFDLAVHIATHNTRTGALVPHALSKFQPGAQFHQKRPTSVGQDAEKLSFRDILAWWGVHQGVEIGLRAERNRGSYIKYGQLDNLPSACELVKQTFRDAGWNEITYNMIVTAWQPHRYARKVDQRKLSKKRNTDAYLSIFNELNRLIEKLYRKDT